MANLTKHRSQTVNSFLCWQSTWICCGWLRPTCLGKSFPQCSRATVGEFIANTKWRTQICTCVREIDILVFLPISLFLSRFGHGAFLVCLENLYKKITGRDLTYTALIGKPSEITYEYSQKLIEEIATAKNIRKLETVYAIG